MRLFLLSLFLVLTLQLVGQSSFGLSIGLDNTKFSGDRPNLITYEFKSGLSLIAFGDFQLTDQVEFSLRAGYAQGGVNIAFKDNIQVDEEDPFIFPIKDNYFSIAPLFKLYNKKRIYAFVGPELGYLLTSDAQVNGQKIDLSDRLNEFALGLDIGLGLNFNMLKQAWAVEWQLNQMLTTLTLKEEIDNGTAPKLRTTRTRVALVYKFKK